MGILSNVINSLTGNLGSEIIGAVEKYFPPEMSAEQKAAAALEIDKLAFEKSKQAIEAQQAAEKSINDRIAMYEGTASDLKAIPYIGAILLALRGCQRIAWGYVTLYFDYKVLSGTWNLADPIIKDSFWIINFLVLGFLFGERAVTNVLPFVTEMFKAKTGKGA